MNPGNYNDNQRMVMDAYLWIRTHNMSIPDHILNVMKDAAIQSFRTIPTEPINCLESKYIVIKTDDLNKYIGKGIDRDCFEAICKKINHLRKKENKDPSPEYVVLNLDDEIDLLHLDNQIRINGHSRYAKVRDIAPEFVNAILKAKKTSETIAGIESLKDDFRGSND